VLLPASHAKAIGDLSARVLVDFVLIGVGGGLFSVPLTVHLQQGSPEDKKGQIIAYSNVAANLVICGAALLPLLANAVTRLLQLGRGGVRLQMLLLAVIALGGAFYFTWVRAEYRVRARAMLADLFAFATAKAPPTRDPDTAR